MADIEAIRMLLTDYQDRLDKLAVQNRQLDEQAKRIQHELAGVLTGSGGTYGAVMTCLIAAREANETSVRYYRQAAILIREYLTRITG